MGGKSSPPKLPSPADIGNAFKSVGNSIKDVANTAVNKVSTGVVDVAKKAETGVKDVAKKAETGVKDVANKVDSVGKDVVNKAGAGLDKFGKDAASGLNQFGKDAAGGLNQFGKDAAGGLNQFGKDAGAGLDKFGKDVGAGLDKFGKDAAGGLNQFGKDAAGGLNQFGDDLRGLFEHSDGPNGTGPMIKLRYTAPPPLPKKKRIPTVVTPTPTSNLKNYNYYPYTTIKTPEQMNISSSGEDGTIDKNLKSIQDYNNALYSGNTKAFVNDTKGQPSGSRYFTPAYDTCLNTDGTAIVDRYYPIDDMLYGKNDKGQINYDNKGVLYSSQSTINKIGSVNLKDNSTNKNCVQVTMVTNQNGSVDTQYVSIDDYKNMDCSAFQNNCKKYYGMSSCEPCNTETTVPTSTPFPTNFNFANSVNNNQFIPVTHYEVLNTKNTPQVTNQPQIVKKENFTDIYNINDDETDKLLNLIYIGSLSIVGVYVLYNIMKKNKLIE
jgi:hypothetical protein